MTVMNEIVSFLELNTPFIN